MISGRQKAHETEEKDTAHYLLTGNYSGAESQLYMRGPESAGMKKDRNEKWDGGASGWLSC